MIGAYRMNNFKLLFFASLAERVGYREQQISVDESVDTVSNLVDFLCQSNNKWTALKAKNIKVAVNQSIASNMDTLKDGDEIAFFPPVTGG